jgi:hypothetical protein
MKGTNMKNRTETTNWSALSNVCFLVGLSLLVAFAITGAAVLAVAAFAMLPLFGLALSKESASRKNARPAGAPFQPFIRDGAENLSVTQAREIMARR